MKNCTILLYVLILITSCSKDTLNLDGFKVINETELFTSLNPSLDFDFFELRSIYLGDTSFFTEFTQGIACENAENLETCLLELENLEPEDEGIPSYCVQICITSYVVAQHEGRNLLFDTTDEVIEFLGPIDTFDEALLLVKLNGYNLGYNDINRGAYKEVENGYEIIATRITATCAPIITTQYKILVDINGTLKVVEEAELNREEDICI